MADFKYYNHLSFLNPFYTYENGEITIESEFQNIFNKSREKRYIDPVSVFQILNKGYLLGDRTLVKGIKKTPFMAKVNSTMTNWDFAGNIPAHSEVILGEDAIAKRLFNLLKLEIIKYVGISSRIAILLTGGMDSRIVACALNEVIKERSIEPGSILGVTWGIENSRDVIYAQKIAQMLKWDWIHLKGEGHQLLDNMDLTSRNGCEYSPIHLHSMCQVANLKGIDCILAGSFGDSIGRGEYSGVHVQNLAPIHGDFRNIGGIFQKHIIELSKQEIKNDIKAYHDLFPRFLNYQQCELDYQIHYMRRMLNPCFNIINKKIPIYQMFTSPEVVNFMWSLHPSCRNNRIYKIILKDHYERLLEIPWARTGLQYGEKRGTPDNFTKNHHDYGRFIRNEILPTLKRKIEDSPLPDMNIFNIKVVHNLFRLIEKFPIENQHYFEDKIIWMAAFGDFLKGYNLLTDFPKTKEFKIKSYFLNTGEYLGRYAKSKL